MERIVERSLSDHREGDERAVEASLRPSRMGEYVGQVKVKERISLFVEAARARGEALDHVLLAGPPGLGKTTLAHIIAHELGSGISVVTGPNVERKGDLAAVLTNLKPRDVLFIDEIHRLPKPIEEVLYSAMEDFALEMIIGQGPAARTLKIDLPRFTLVGATTRSGLLSSPLRDRFGVQLRLEFYPEQELEEILSRSARLLRVPLDREAALEIARRSRGTPRIANRLLKRVRDFAQVRAPHHTGAITRSIARQALELLDIDERGLDEMDRRFLRAIIEKYDGGPVGIENLASVLGEERDTLEDIYEPFLLQESYVQRTPRGRMATRAAYEHLEVAYPEARVAPQDGTQSVFQPDLTSPG